MFRIVVENEGDTASIGHLLGLPEHTDPNILQRQPFWVSDNLYGADDN
jgi:hypothetical protein